MGSDPDQGPYLKGQGHTSHLKMSTQSHAPVCSITYLWVEASTGDIAVLWTALPSCS